MSQCRRAMGLAGLAATVALAGCSGPPVYSNLTLSCYDSGAIRAFLESGGDPDALIDITGDPDNPETASLLACASQNNSPMLVNYLLELEALVNQQDREGDTALLHTTRPEIAQLLILHGADVNLGDFERRTPLHFAALGDRRPLVKLYLEAGADPNAADSTGSTPLHSASSAETAALLIQHGANPNLQNQSGATPLQYAHAYQDDMGAARVLIQHGADVNARDREGDTPLHIIACDRQYCDRAAAEAALLLRHGADPLIKNHQGKTALDRAIAAQRQDLIQLFQNPPQEPRTKNEN